MKELKKYDTFEITLKNWKNYIITLSNKFNINLSDELFDDLYQEGSIALYNAYINYNEELSSTFHSYAVQAIRNSMIKFINRNTSTIRRPIKLIKEQQNIKFISTSTYIEDGSITTVGDTLFVEDEDISIDDIQLINNKAILKAADALNDQQRYVVFNYLGINYQNEKMTLQDIAEQLGVTRQAVCNQYKNSVKKLKKYYNK